MKKSILLLLMLVSVNMSQALNITPQPVVDWDVTDDAVIITANGEGEVILYINDDVIENPCTIARGDTDMYVYAFASAQANGMEISYCDVVEILIPSIDDPVDPHMTGYWLVLRDRFGREVWKEMWYDDYGNYIDIINLYYSIYGGYNPETDERPLVPFNFVIDGIRYGASSPNTEAVLGYPHDNPLIEEDNFYLLPAGGKSIFIGVAQDTTGEKYLYAAMAGYPDPGYVYEDPTLYITGDVDSNAKVTIADVTTMIDYLLTGYSTGLNMDNADVNGSGKVTIEDVTLLIDYLLKGSWW